MPTKSLAISAIVAVTGALAGVPAESQEAIEVTIPADSMVCLVENQDKYLELPRNVIIFFAVFCPAVSREEVMQFVQNSAEEEDAGVRLILLKSDFRCLVQKIQEHLETASVAGETADELVALSLNCG